MRYPDEIVIGAYTFRRTPSENKKKKQLLWVQVTEPGKYGFSLRKERGGWQVDGPFQAHAHFGWWSLDTLHPTPEKALIAYVTHNRVMMRKRYETHNKVYKDAIKDALKKSKG